MPESADTDIYDQVQREFPKYRNKNFFNFKKIAASSLKSLKIDSSTAKLWNNTGEGKGALFVVVQPLAGTLPLSAGRATGNKMAGVAQGSIWVR